MSTRKLVAIGRIGFRRIPVAEELAKTPVVVGDRRLYKAVVELIEQSYQQGVLDGERRRDSFEQAFSAIEARWFRGQGGDK